MRALHEALLALGFSRKQVLWLPDPALALEALVTLIRTEDLILIKGSQSMRMEIITQQLLANPVLAREVLCRQSDVWRAKPFVPPAEWTEEM
jgi:hypothetical protein